jgi:hypothetical protein
MSIHKILANDHNRQRFGEIKRAVRIRHFKYLKSACKVRIIIIATMPDKNKTIMSELTMENQ